MPQRNDTSSKRADLRLGTAIVAQAQAGDRGAQRQLLEGSYDYVRRLLYRMVGRSTELDDLQQTVLMKIAHSLSSFRGDSAFSTWVGGICVHVVKDHLRAKRRAPTFVTEVALAQSPAGVATVPDPVDTAHDRQALSLVTRALDKLSANHRLVFVLCHVLGHSIEEAATMTHSACSTTRMRLYYARKAFARAVDSDDELQAQAASRASETP